MMHVVVGSGYGDEGKGLITDYLVRKLGAKLVARFNGGAQASHTVEADGRRHAFSHMSAGTFAGAATWLSSDFIINPLALSKEVQALRAMGVEPPPIYASSKSRVTLIYDMVINALLENSRGFARHGSCGLGINETVTRYEASHGHILGWLRTGAERQLIEELGHVLNNWVPYRLESLSLKPTDDDHRQFGSVLNQPDLLRDADALYSGMRYLNVVDDVYLLCMSQQVVLEGAQGLMLDEELGQFPHVTRSKTGLIQAMTAANEVRHYREPLKPVYVTRCYATRHGAGPLPHAGEFFTENENITDATNVPNPWQGTLRYAPLDLKRLKTFINEDLARARKEAIKRGLSPSYIEQPVLALTCVDQLVRSVVLYDSKERSRTICVEDLVPLIEEEVELKVKFVSHGPSAATVEER
jgi:adenylosuccinate synthase